jgi:hypothetical protein
MKTRLAWKILKNEERYSEGKVAYAERLLDRHIRRRAKPILDIFRRMPASWCAENALKLGWTDKAFTLLMETPEEKW